MNRAFFVAATGQNVGKTTTCLGLVSGLKGRGHRVGYLKPVGQEHVEVGPNLYADKDVLLFREHFHLTPSPTSMSPVLFPRGFTRDYLDGKVDRNTLLDKIRASYRTLCQQSDFLIVEGTGHMGVGSIVDLNNAQVARELNLPVLLVVPAGLGSAFDDLSLSVTMCKQQGARIGGIILNRMMPEKREMILTYMQKAIASWNVPLLGAIPYHPFLSFPTMRDFESLFQTVMIAGETHRLRHFEQVRLATSPDETSRTSLHPSTLFIVSSDREEILLPLLTRYWDHKISKQEELNLGLILTGRETPKETLVDLIRRADIPTLFTPLPGTISMKMIHSFTAKIRQEDEIKIREATHLVEGAIDFDRLLQIS